MAKKIPNYHGTLRSHSISIPQVIYECSGITIFGRRIKSLAFSTDVAIIKNINTDAILAVYPFTPQSSITDAIISVSDVPVFVGVGGGSTNSVRCVRLAEEAEMQGAYGVVVNAPISADVIRGIKSTVEIPIVATVISTKQDIKEKVDAGADIINISGAKKTVEIVKHVRDLYPDIPIIATGGPTDDTILATINAGANAITYTPETCGHLFSMKMDEYRNKYD